MKHRSLDDLVASGEATPIRRDRSVKEMLEIAASAFEGREKERFKPLQYIEEGPWWVIRWKSTTGTVFEPVVAKLREAGVRVDPWIGSVASVLRIHRMTLHDLFCVCKHPEIPGDGVIRRFRTMAAQYS